MAANEPENSLSAFKASKKLGYKIVETDLQLTKDGQWVILHDYTLDRTSTGMGTIKSKSLKHIKKLSLKGGTKNERLSIPELEEFLSLCSSEGLIPILDIKPNEKEIASEDYDSLLMSLSKYDLLDKSIFTSSSKEVLTELRRRDNLTAIAVMMDASLDNLEFTKKLNNAFIYLSYENLTDEKINLINNNNLRFGVWTINDEKVAKHFLEKGALMIVTDNLLGGK
jgi:glycerophosphoryl diester phosphodiesterase